MKLQEVDLSFMMLPGEPVQGDQSGLRLDFVDFDSRGLPFCLFVTPFQPVFPSRTWQTEEQTIYPSQQIFLSNHRGHPVQCILTRPH